jgi:MFS family permease
MTSEEKNPVVGASFIAGFFMSRYHGPLTAVIHDMVPRRAHTSSVGVYIFATQLFGGILGPYVVGRLDDLADLILGLRVAVVVMTSRLRVKTRRYKINVNLLPQLTIT